MAHAFVIEYDPNHNNLPIVVDANYEYYRFCDPEEKRNQCNFAFQSYGEKHYCYYPTSNAFYAKVLCRLMKQISNFQMHCQVHNSINKHVENHGYTGLTNVLLGSKNYSESLREQWERYCRYDYSNPEHKHYHKNIPFNVSEIDTKKAQDFKPCFFCQEYKLHDENGHPLYVVVMLERKNSGTEDEDLFNFNIKFIGSSQPLTKLVSRIPLCNDDELYQDKVYKYRIKHNGYYKRYEEVLCEMIVHDDFKQHFETYDYKTNHRWNKCEIIMCGRSCPKYEYSYIQHQKMCTEDRCPFYRGMTYETKTHNGKIARKLFEKAFGEKLTKMIIQGEFANLDKWERESALSKVKRMLPEVSNVRFIKAFNAFCAQEGLWYGMDYFDDTGDIAKRKKYMESRIKHVNNWANTPGYEILRFKTNDGEIHTIQSPLVVRKDIQHNKQSEKADTTTMTTHLAELKKQLLEKNMSGINNPAIYIKSPGKTEIIKCYDAPYMDQIGYDDYEEFVDVYVNYKKPKLKEPQEITYRFTNTWIGYYFMEGFRELKNMQHSKDGNLKWASSRLFPKDKGAVTTDPYGLDIRMGAKEDVIEILRPGRDYNGITILNPQKMTPIVCDHYEINNVEYHQGHYINSNVLLFNAKNEVSGIIHTSGNDGIKAIIPHIITRNNQQRTR